MYVAGFMVDLDEEGIPTHPLSVYRGYRDAFNVYQEKGLILSLDQFKAELAKSDKKKMKCLVGIDELEVIAGIDLKSPSAWKGTILITDEPNF